MAGFDDRYWQSADGLKLHYRDYAGGDDRPPILCIPGLTRNARDFEEVAARLAGAWRVLAVDLRGRGFASRQHRRCHRHERRTAQKSDAAQRRSRRLTGAPNGTAKMNQITPQRLSHLRKQLPHQ